MAIQVSMSGLDLSFLREEDKKKEDLKKSDLEAAAKALKELAEPREKVMNKKAKK